MEWWEQYCSTYNGSFFLNSNIYVDSIGKLLDMNGFPLNQVHFNKQVNPLVMKKQYGGWGLICEQDLEPEQYVGEYLGEVICRWRAKLRSPKFLMEVQLEPTTHCFIDGSKFGGICKYINHSCNPNCYSEVFIENGYPTILIFTKRDVPSGTFLSIDYFPKRSTIFFDDLDDICQCGEYNCKYKTTP
jgi:[histone H3]-lysine36 N-trimethyltransferase